MDHSQAKNTGPPYTGGNHKHGTYIKPVSLLPPRSQGWSSTRFLSLSKIRRHCQSFALGVILGEARWLLTTPVSEATCSCHAAWNPVDSGPPHSCLPLALSDGFWNCLLEEASLHQRLAVIPANASRKVSMSITLASLKIEYKSILINML